MVGEEDTKLQPLIYLIEGPEILKDRVPLYEVISTLKEYMNIIDRSYLTLMEKGRLSKKERDKYKIIAYKFDPGSLHIDLAIELYEVAQMLFPVMMPVGATGLWNLAKHSYEFVKIVTKLRDKGIEPSIHEDNRVNYYIIGDNNNIVINPKIGFNSDKIEESVQKIGGFIKPGAVDRIALNDSSGDGIEITDEERRLFNPETMVSDDAETITVKIYRLDVESKKGKLKVLDGLDSKDLSFQIIGDQLITPYIDALKADSVVVNILRETAVGLSGKPYLKRIHIIGFPGSKNVQRKLFE